MKKLILLIGVLLLIPLVTSLEQTQQFNKIYLTPFYRENLALNTNYTYTVTVNPPDGISAVTSAIINMNAQINGQTQNFTLWVNGRSCNNPSYYIATAYSATGNSQMAFDCSNVITQSGTYTITLRSAVNTGVVSAWLDITYMNNPGRKIDIFGTEYQVGDAGKVFVQLLENSITPINNASCYSTLFYPSGTKWMDKSLMAYQSGSNGLYYIDFTVPATTGVYMTDVYCEYYTQTQSNNATNYVQITGWYVNGTGASLTRVDTDYLVLVERNTNGGFSNVNGTTILAGHLDEYNGTSTEDTSPSSSNGTHYNGVLIGRAGTSGAGTSYDGGNDYTNYPAATKFNVNTTDSYMVCFAFNQTTSNTNGNRIVDSTATAPVEGFRFSFDGGNQIRFVSDRSGTAAQTIQTATTYIDGQWHTVCGYASLTTMSLYIDGSLLVNASKIQSGSMTLSQGVTIGATLPGPANNALVSVDELCYVKGPIPGSYPDSIASSYYTNKQCGVPTNTLDLNITISNITVLPNYVNYNIVSTYQWNELVETADVYIYNYTGSRWYKLPNSLSYSTADATVSSQLTMNITQFLNGGVMTLKINDSMPTGATIGTLRLNQVRLDQIAYVQTPATQIRGGGEVHVSNYVAQIPQNVWTYTNRTLTTSFTQVDMTNYTLINQSIQDAKNETINVIYSVNASLSNEINGVPALVWAYATRTLTSPPENTTAISAAVWNYLTRNLTYYPTQTDLTNYTSINEGVWNYTARYVYGILN